MPSLSIDNFMRVLSITCRPNDADFRADGEERLAADKT